MVMVPCLLSLPQPWSHPLLRMIQVCLLQVCLLSLRQLSFGFSSLPVQTTIRHVSLHPVANGPTSSLRIHTRFLLAASFSALAFSSASAIIACVTWLCRYLGVLDGCKTFHQFPVVLSIAVNSRSPCSLSRRLEPQEARAPFPPVWARGGLEDCHSIIYMYV
jgi:hypothetical protein